MHGIGVARINLARISIFSKNFRRTTAFTKTSANSFPIETLNQATVISKNYPINFTLAATSLLTYLGLAKKDEFEKFQEIVEKAEKALQEKDFKLAEQLFHEALNIARTQLMNESEVTRMYDRLAEVAFESGNYKSARKLYSSLMERLFSIGVEQNDLRILNLSLKLARTMEQLRKYSEAELGYRFCFNGIQTHLSVNNPDLYKAQEFLLMLFMSYAYFHYERGLLNKALEYFLQAYEVCVRTRGEDYPLIVLVLNNLGLVYRRKGDNENALRYFQQAEKLGKNFSDSNDMAYVHLNLGYLHLEEDMLMEARRHCKQAFKQSKRMGDEEGKKGSKECLAEVRKALFSRIYSKVS